MGFIIAPVILWLILTFVFDSYIVSSVICGALIILFFVIGIRNGKKQKKQENASNTDNKYSGIQYRPINQKPTAAKQTVSNAFPKYEVFHRNRDKFCDNMNYMLYQCRGTYAQTNRKRTLTIEAFTEDDAKEQLKQKGFIEPFEIERIQFPEVTNNQKDALGNIYFGDVCQFDASALLNKQYDKDSTPNPELITYATECGVKFSYYIGKKALYDLVFNTIDLKEKIAFFVFCIYRYTTNDRQGNLHNSLYQDYFYKFAEENIGNESFLKSMNKYNGSDLRFFGKLTVNNVQFSGGSTNTNAYKTVIEYLRQRFTLSTIANKAM